MKYFCGYNVGIVGQADARSIFNLPKSFLETFPFLRFPELLFIVLVEEQVFTLHLRPAKYIFSNH